jgi:hypothetical protein
MMESGGKKLPTTLMHPKFARRLAAQIRAKKKAVGQEGTTAWFKEQFPNISTEQIRQVTQYLKQMG